MAAKTTISGKGVVVSPDIPSPGRLVIRVPTSLSNSLGMGNFDITNVNLINGIDITTLSSSGSFPAGALHVAVTGATYDNFSTAVSASSPGDTILIYPGTYTIANPVNLPGNLTIKATGYAKDTILLAQNHDSNLLNIGSNTYIEGLTLSGSTNASSLFFGPNVVNSEVREIIARDAKYGFHASGSGKGCVVWDSSGGGTVDTLFKAEAAGNLHCINCLSAGTTLTVQTGVLATDAGTTLNADKIVFNNLPGPAYGCYVDNSASLYLNDVVVFNSEISAFYVGVGGGTLRGASSIALNSTGNDLVVNSDEATVLFSGGGVFKREKVFIPKTLPLENLSLIFQNDTTNERGLNVVGNLSVGDNLFGHASSFGFGDSTSRTIKSFTDDGSGTSFVDITSYLTQAGGPPVAIFPSVSSGSVFYFGSSDGGNQFAFNNLKFDIDSKGVTNPNSVTIEYLSGTSGTPQWSEVGFLVTEAAYPYAQFDQNLFSKSSSSFNVRLELDEEQSIPCQVPGFVTGTVNGIDGWWMRMKVSSSIASSPTINSLKIGKCRFDISKDGFTEKFGSAIAKRALSNVSLSSVVDLQGASPGNGSINIAPNLILTPDDNQFNNNVSDGFGQMVELSYGIDTSRPLDFRLGFVGTSNNLGSVNFELRVAENLGQGVNVDAGTAPVKLYPVTSSIGANQSSLLQIVEIPFYLRNTSVGDFWAWSLIRQGGNDSYDGNIKFSFLEVEGWWWL